MTEPKADKNLFQRLLRAMVTGKRLGIPADENDDPAAIRETMERSAKSIRKSLGGEADD